jgi:predicted RNase H-like HicB family nuclease
MYGEGETIEEATENLIDSILEYVDIYISQIDLFSRVESMEKQIYMLKLIRCNDDREALKKVLGL